MKRLLLLFVAVILCGSFCDRASIVPEVQREFETSNYQENSPKWSEEKLNQYCLENGILPSTPLPGTGDKLTEENIVQHLVARFPGDYSWTKLSSESNSVASTYGGEPIDAYEFDPLVQEAKSLSKISDNDAIGCGPLALLTQLDFLYRYAGYSQFVTNPESDIQKKKLYIDIFNTIKTFPKNSEPALSLQLMGFTFDDGTFTFPHHLKSMDNCFKV